MMTKEMTLEEARQYLRELFAKAGKPDEKYRPDAKQFDYLSRDGAQRFKKEALGLSEFRAVKSLDEVAELLVKTGIASDLEEGRQTVPKIAEANKLHPQAISRKNLCTYLKFEEVKGPNEDLRYRITAWSTD